MKPPLIILSGPTASGKTTLSLKLAKKVNGSVISADSMQAYRYMDIGSAKIKEEEREGIPHYLIDECLPTEEFHVALFQKRAKQYMAKIYGQGKIPILVGGSGFYIQSVLYQIDFLEEAPSPIREELTSFVQTNGKDALYERLLQLDPASAFTIHKNNVKRVLRALEFYMQNGFSIAAHNERERQKESPYRFAYFVLNESRERVYGRINQRVDDMMEQGLLEEVKKLRQMGCKREMVSMQGLGYKELFAHLEGEISLEEAVYQIKRNTRHFAKRQLTWFGREKEAIWLNKEEFDYKEEAILEKMAFILRKKGILV